MSYSGSPSRNELGSLVLEFLILLMLSVFGSQDVLEFREVSSMWRHHVRSGVTSESQTHSYFHSEMPGLLE